MAGLLAATTLAAGNETGNDAFSLQTQLAGLPSFPPLARRDDVSGSITIGALLDTEGRPASVRVIDAGPEGYFEATALKRFERRWQFHLPPYLPRCSLVEARVTFHFDHETKGYPVRMDPPQGVHISANGEGVTPLPTLDVYRDALGRAKSGWTAAGEWPHPPSVDYLPEPGAGIARLMLDDDGRVADVDVVAVSNENLQRFLVKTLLDWPTDLDATSVCLAVDIRKQKPSHDSFVN